MIKAAAIFCTLCDATATTRTRDNLPVCPRCAKAVATGEATNLLADDDVPPEERPTRPETLPN